MPFLLQCQKPFRFSISKWFLYVCPDAVVWIRSLQNSTLSLCTDFWGLWRHLRIRPNWDVSHWSMFRPLFYTQSKLCLMMLLRVECSVFLQLRQFLCMFLYTRLHCLHFLLGSCRVWNHLGLKRNEGREWSYRFSVFALNLLIVVMLLFGLPFVKVFEHDR